MRCDKGMVYCAFPYEGCKLVLKLFEGHGVALFRQPGSGMEAYGVIDYNTETLIWGDGGSIINPGDILVHTADLCRAGLEKGCDLPIKIEPNWQEIAEKRTKQVIELQNLLSRRE